MDGLWTWGWERFGRRYSWVVFFANFLTLWPVIVTCVLAVLVFEGSDRYVLGVAGATAAMIASSALVSLPGSTRVWSTIEQWATDNTLPSTRAMERTYAFVRGAFKRTVLGWTLLWGACAGWTGLIAGADGPVVAQWAALGAMAGASNALGGVHFWVEGAMRPVREAISKDDDVGDHLPRARPTFTTWLVILMIGLGFGGVLAGAVLGDIIDLGGNPAIAGLMGIGYAVSYTLPLTVGTVMGPTVRRPLRELMAGTQRVASGDYSQRLPVVQDDDLGVIAASFNQMQAGLIQRERLQTAFGSYVDPSLAERLLAQGDDLFSGERVDVTVMFVDIRDFTPFAEANSAEATVTMLNTIFEIVVATTRDHGGHVNKFLGDGAMVVFGAPEKLDDHAGRAVDAAVEIQRQVHDRVGTTTRVGIGINTGSVIAGTIGGAGKLEFTLIGDTVNVAARVEQLTKETADSILLTDATASEIDVSMHDLQDRGSHELKGKSAPVIVHAVTMDDLAPA